MLDSQGSVIGLQHTASRAGLKEHLPRQYEKKRYYTWLDIEPHSFAHDLWVVLFGNVLDLTELIQSNITSPLCQPIIDFAGKDITHWFSHKTKEPRTKIDADSGRQVFYCPNGR